VTTHTDMPTTVSELAPLFNEPIAEVRWREENALEELLNSRQRRVVLFGAGTLGKRALELLKGIQCQVLAFSDNNTASWESSVGALPVLSPQVAAKMYGDNALFLVTIWNDRHWFGETYAKLVGLGCSLVSTYMPIFWRFPETFLQLYLLNEPPHRLYAESGRVLEAEKIWADEYSLNVYRANIRWRALGDALDLPARPAASTYFPKDLFSLNAQDVLLDCGAFDGDTIGEILTSSGGNFDSIHAVEADAVSFGRLQGYKDTLGSLGSRIRLYQCALGRSRGVVHFESNGTLTSKASEVGPAVELWPIDQLFANTRLTLIKMDIEGAEYDALNGAAQMIRRDRPILAICVYHSQSDIWRIPLLVNELVPEYRLYLRAYEGDGFQTVMYAVPPQRADPFV
jgi:FkbM family methyltransferase